MNFEKVKRVHFLGIGGIGMSALARYFKLQGKEVSGYDKTTTQLTDELINEGIEVYFEENINLIPQSIKNDPTSTENLIIYTPAIPIDHVELEFFRNQKCNLFKRAQILGLISKNIPTAAIAGTHGKTTTTSILTFLCLSDKQDFVSFVGGINENFNSNLIYSGDPKFMVCEADEYDRSFLQLNPACGIITSMDADHLDIYGNAESMHDTFKEFADLVADNGMLLINKKISQHVRAEHKTYALTNDADFCASDINFDEGVFHFNFIGKDVSIKDLEFHVPGFHNVENAVAAIALAIHLGVSADSIRSSLKLYKGVKRRFEYHKVKEGMIYVDDYAHHPEEINAVLSSLRKMYPGKNITGVFQPHLFSRTRDLAEGFALSLSKLDELILLDIYPAREKPIEGINSAWLLNQVEIDKKTLCSKEGLINCIEKTQPEVLVTMGAGDIDKLISGIAKHFSV